jgi:hypothetical protein
MDSESGDTRRRYVRRIRAFSRMRRRFVNGALAYRCGTAMLGMVAALLAAPAVWADAPLLDAGLLAAAMLAFAALAAGYLLRRARFRGDLSEAFRMEALVGNLNSRLISALDFLENGNDTPLTAFVIEAAGRDLEAVPFEDRLDRASWQRSRRYFLGALALVLLLGSTPWFGFRQLWARAGEAWGAAREIVFRAEWQITPAPGRHIRRIGETSEVILQFTRNPPERVTAVQDEPDKRAAGETRATLPVAADGTVRVRLRSDAECVRRVVYEFGRRTVRTRPVEVVFTTAPVLEDMQIDTVPPVYTRQPPRELIGVQTRIAGLPGTRVSLGLTFSKSLAAASIRFDPDPEEIPLDVVGRFATIQLVISDGRRARIQVRDVHGFALAQPCLLDIDVLTDEPPHIVAPGFLKADMPIKAEALRTFRFGVRAWDDFGVARTVLKWRQSTLDDRDAVRAQGEVERVNAPPLATVIPEFLNVFADIRAQPGDFISFRIEATDNRDPNPQTAATPTFSFFVHQDDLDGGAMGQNEDLMSGSFWGSRVRQRLERHRTATEVPQPTDLRSVSQWASDYEANVTSGSRAPTVRGDFGSSVERYFKILSTAVFKEKDEE